jgi:hypothetical protein
LKPASNGFAALNWHAASISSASLGVALLAEQMAAAPPAHPVWQKGLLSGVTVAGQQ